MPAPLVVVGASMIGSIALGYILEKEFGDGHYSSKDLAVDATMGIIPGVGYAKPVVGLARHGRNLRRMGLSRSMYSTRELYVYPFLDDALQLFYRTPIVGSGVHGMYNAVAKIGHDRSENQSIPFSSGLTRKAKMRGATSVVPKNGKCPPGYYYDKKTKSCMKKKVRYNKKRN
jgi:hypothetical protein